MEDKSYLELHLPEYLEEDLREFKRLQKTDRTKATGYWGEVYSSINMAYVEDEITDEQAKYLRRKYLGI